MENGGKKKLFFPQLDSFCTLNYSLFESSNKCKKERKIKLTCARIDCDKGAESSI